MRPLRLLTVVIALVITVVPSQQALAQEVIDLPTYTAGDFWRYEIRIPDISDLLEEEELIPVDLIFHANLTVMIEGVEEVDVNGETRSTYNSSQSLEIQVGGSAEISLGEEVTNVTFTGNVGLNASLYLDQDGLEPLKMQADAGVYLTLGIESFGFDIPAPVEANGTAELVLEYTRDTWDFPLEVGNRGEEEFRGTGTAYGEFTLLGETTGNGSSFHSNATVIREVEREETVDVSAGTFRTLVVKTTVQWEDEGAPTTVPGWELVYWSSQAGAPVKREVYNETGGLQAELNLTDHRYQTAERLSILGLDIIYWIPIGIGVAVVVAVLVLLARRARM